MKKILLGLFTVFCIWGIWAGAFETCATNTYVSLYIDCDGGTCHTTNGMDLISGENRALVGSTVSSVYHFDEDPTAVDKDFIGWYVYNKATNAQIPGTGLLTTAQVNSYVIPSHNIEFVAQWTPRAGYPVKNITYAAFYNGEGEPCYDVKITIIKDGISYSGYGLVSIPESVYSTWKGNLEVIWEPLNGHYIQANGKWQSEPITYTDTANSFRKEESMYCTANATNTGKEVISPRRKVHDWYYQASFVAPEISVLKTGTAEQVISNTAVVPATYTVETEIFQSGSTFDSAVNAALSSYGTNNVVVVDIELKDDNGANVTQLSDYVDVRVDIPDSYNIQPGNTVIVYYLNANGSLEKCDTTYYADDPNNRYVTFKTNHFSVYVLVESAVVDIKETEEVPEEISETASEETSQTKPEEMQEETSGVEEQSKEQNDTSETDEPEMQETGGETSTGRSFSYLSYVIAGGILIVIVIAFVLKAAGRRKKRE